LTNFFVEKLSRHLFVLEVYVNTFLLQEYWQKGCSLKVGEIDTWYLSKKYPSKKAPAN
jgi:hypothetical protein